MIVRDYDADDLDDDEGWRGDPDQDEEDTTDDCPNCGASIYDDSERCPRCGLYVSREDAPRRKPWWVVLGAMACLAMVTYWILNP